MFLHSAEEKHAMKKIIAISSIILLTALSGCASKTGGTLLGGVAGAGAGAALSGGNAIATGVGAVGGAVAGNVLSGPRP